MAVRPAEVAPVLGGREAVYLELSRLVRLGWLFRLRRGRYAAVEYSSKAALFRVGIPPEDHRDYAVLRRHRGAFPRRFRSFADVWADDDERATKHVVRARYGSPETDRTPDEVLADDQVSRTSIGTAGRLRAQIDDLLRDTSARTARRE